jgi:hypothetical protein
MPPDSPTGNRCTPANPAAQAGSVVTTCNACSITPRAVAIKPSNQARTRLGVGESTKLTFSLGSATWVATAPNGQGIDAPVAGLAVDAHGSAATFTAGDRNQTVTIRATGSGCTATIILQIVEPDALYMIRTPHTLGKHLAHNVSVGFIGDYYLLPEDVSFEHCRFLEKDARGIGEGCYARASVPGHDPNPVPLPVKQPTDDVSGSMVKIYDRVAVQDLRSCVGMVFVPIPTHFQVGNHESKEFHIVDQVMTTDADGTATIYKASASNTSRLADDQEIDPIFNLH